ncbi:uncharacterized protein LOC117780874 [Drosophila innubila]|uniref:uncharacterized protein LOC117780874 n=1 Tax=Drosophila innubila TaxID=198719 RepID=UPI00148BACDA|nr:uncharacterized protein LOC117780874 [Drosophila innubila]
MRRLLLIQITLWSFVSAIPQEDLSLIKQVELLCENTYKLIMQNKLEFCTYAAKEVVDCKAANETELEKWQHWLDLSNAERFNITENEILNYVDKLADSLPKSYDHYIPKKDLQESLNRCTKGAFGDKHVKYVQSNSKILKSFEKEASPILQEVTDATRQSDIIFFESFDYFVKNGSENIFMFIRSKLIKYEDRAFLIEVKNLAQETYLEMQRSYMKYFMIEVETIISCDAVNGTELKNLKILVGLIREKLDTLTDDEFKDFSYLLYVNLPHREQVYKVLNNCAPGIRDELEAKITMEAKEMIEAFIENATPKMHQVSGVTKQSQKNLFLIFERISNLNNEFSKREYAFIIFRGFIDFF